MRARLVQEAHNPNDQAQQRPGSAPEGVLMLPRRGVIEIELLRRYGRTPPGTCAVGWFKVSATGYTYFTHLREIHIRVADDPRVVGGPCWFPWAPPRGTSRARSEAGLLE